MPATRKIETILTENKIVSAEQLEQIVSYAQAVGIDLYEAILQKKIAPPETVMMAYAESIGLPFIHIGDVSIDEEVAAKVDPMTARQYSFLPISVDQKHVLLATAKPIIPDVEEELRMIFNLPIRCVICMPAELSDAITKYYPRGTARIDKTERGKALAPQPEKKKPKPVKPMNEEEQKDILLKAAVAFCFSFAFVGLALNFLQIPSGIYNTWYQLPLSLLLGSLVGGVAGWIVWKALSR